MYSRVPLQWSGKACTALYIAVCYIVYQDIKVFIMMYSASLAAHVLGLHVDLETFGYLTASNHPDIPQRGLPTLLGLESKMVMLW
jgi:hypothetical protein